MDAGPSKELLALQTAVAGRYAVEREIGRGGMGIVCRARDLALERPVAIKLLPPELAAHEDLRERFLREARTAASLAHPHIVPIHLIEAHDAVVFFVMGYIDGETLTSRVQRASALPALEVGRIIQEVAWALGYAHGRGVVHRDIKPDNILIEHATARLAGLGAAATIVLATLKRFVPRFPHIVIVIGGFAAIVTFAIALVVVVTRSARMQRSNLLYYNAVWRRWFGRWLFRVAGIGLRRMPVTTPTTDVATLVGDVSNAASTADRGVLNAAAELFAQLSAQAADLLVTERELDRAMAEAGAPPVLSAPLVAAAAPQRGGAGHAAVPSALLERRSLGVEQLRSARDDVARRRASMQIAADNLRIQLLRLRARTGTLGELEQDIGTARGLLDAARRSA